MLFIIDAINEKKDRNAALISLAKQGHLLACCPVKVGEVYAGLRPKEEQKTSALLHSLELYPISRILTIHPDARRKHIAIFGKSSVGKGTLLRKMWAVAWA